ncbi:MAG TPA: isocitrate lyase, partial [Actinomycetota bacterium]
MTEAIEQRIREQAADLERRWSTDPRWKGVERTYTAEDVIRLQGSFHVEHSIARAGAERLWELVHNTE